LKKALPPQSVVLFDGVCNFCNRMVNFAIRHDKKGKLKFAALQSKAGQQFRQQYNIAPSIDSVIVIDEGKVFTHSNAALRIARYLDFPARMLYILSLFPSFIRQPIYKWVARNRYKWFGRKESCMIPGPDIKARFLE
jgi:predicted DCC family thiol-disulfide oxidoreductase YuxK